jgi:MFS transporter, DHA1 family, tetracycline resistance protein
MHRSSLAVLYLTVFIDLLGFGIILPLLPYYAERFGASGVWVGVLLSAYSLAQFLGAPLLGRLSDRFGRRPLLLLSLTGSAISLAVSGLSQGLGMLIAARAVAGLFGGSISTAQAYIADVTDAGNRARYMGMLGASIGLGFVFGPALGSGLSRFGFGTAAFVAATLAAANLAFAVFRLEESRRPGTGRRVRLGLAGFVRALKDPSIGRVLVTMFLSVLAFVAMEATFALLGERRFGLDSGKLGFVFTYIGVIIVLVQGGLVGRLTARVGERALAVGGSLLMAAALAAIPLAPRLWSALVALGLLAVGQALVFPTVATLLSNATSADEQGGTLGLGTSMGAAARAAGPIIAGWLFDRSLAMPYFMGAVALLATALLLATLRVGGERVEPAHAVEPVQS